MSDAPRPPGLVWSDTSPAGPGLYVFRRYRGAYPELLQVGRNTLGRLAVDEPGWEGRDLDDFGGEWAGPLEVREPDGGDG